MRLLFFPFIVASVLSAASAQAPAKGELARGNPIVAGTQYDIVDRASRESYRIYVQKPNVPPPPKGYPVFYLLDGNLQYRIAAGIAPMRAYQSRVPHAVIVGIGYPDSGAPAIQRRRTGDYITPIPFDKLPPNLQALKPEPGHADRFLRFLTEQVRPFVERHAPIDRNCQALFGHSLGGFFVLHTLFTRPDLFQAYIAASPSIPFGDRALLKEEAPFVARAAAAPIHARLLIAAGELEPLATDASALADRLGALTKSGLSVSKTIFADENHVSVIPSSINKGLQFGLQCPEQR